MITAHRGGPWCCRGAWSAIGSGSDWVGNSCADQLRPVHTADCQGWDGDSIRKVVPAFGSLSQCTVPPFACRTACTIGRRRLERTRHLVLDRRVRCGFDEFAHRRFGLSSAVADCFGDRRFGGDRVGAAGGRSQPGVAERCAAHRRGQEVPGRGHRRQQAVDSAQADIDAAQEVVAADVVNNTSLRDGQRAACGSPPSDGTQTDPCVAAMAVTRRPLPRRPVAPGGYLPFATAGSTTAHVTDSSRGAGTRAVQIRVGSSLGGTAQGGVRRSSRGRGVIARIARRSSRDGSQHG
jgi:hypothetical protein